MDSTDCSSSTERIQGTAAIAVVGCIRHEPGNKEAWHCICGNTPENGGFYSCNRNGAIVEPAADFWFDGLYLCFDCRRIIDPDTLRIVGSAVTPALHEVNL